MKPNTLYDIPEYKPSALLDEVARRMKAYSDSRLSRALGLTPPQICKLRKKLLPLNGDMLVRIFDLAGIPVDEQREIAGIPKTKQPVTGKDYAPLRKPAESQNQVYKSGEAQ